MTINGASGVPHAVQPAAAPTELVIARLRRHGRMLFWPVVLMVIVLAVVSYFAGRFPQQWENIALLAAGALLLIVGFFLPLLSWLTRRYTLTTRRIIVRHGFFVHVRQELLHSRGYTVSVRRSWAQSAFRTGDIVMSAAQEQPVVLRDVPNAALVQATLHDLMEANQSMLASRRQGEPPPAPDDHTVVWGQR